jgi:hypothetical protein
VFDRGLGYGTKIDLYPDQDVPPGDWLHWTGAAQTWNGMCAECHSTNLRKGYDAEKDAYTTTWSEIDVSCEACHGPGSAHVQWANIQPMARPEIDNHGLVVNTGSITPQQEVELCAPCHSRRSELGDYDHTQAALLDHQIPSLLQEGLYHADGQILEEVYVWGSFTQSKMYDKGIRCSDCHDSHSLQHRAQGNALCLQCHRVDAYDTAEHHFHKKTFEGKPSDGALCVKCHMPETRYMVIDARADHSIRVPRPDLRATLGTPDACSRSGCHGDKPIEWVLEAYDRWYGLARKPHFAGTFHNGRKGLPDAAPELVRMAGDPLLPAIVRASALTLLVRYPGNESARVFEHALSDPEPLVRHAAVRNLPAGDPQRLVRLTVPLLFDPLRAVRTEAAVRLADAPEELMKSYQKEAQQAALREYEQAMLRSLDFSFAGHNLGNLYVRLGKPEAAEKVYRRAIAVDELSFPPKVNLAMLLNSAGRKQEAAELLRQVVEAHPVQYEAAYNYGLLLAEMRRFREAENFLARAAEGMPGHAGAQRNLRAVREVLSAAENR